ncbi:MAG: pyridoxal-phosphate dependent enzyme, partial [Calditrichaeota bacterium]|nr:pyridoxal-phosphate dependent enzyme [Calditrichota bacterium]
SIIEDAEANGLLKPGSTIIEATSGNTGVGLVLASIDKGYRFIFVMPDKMSEEKRNFLRAFGAEVVIVPSTVPPHHPEHYNNKAKQLAKDIPNSFLANQFYNQSNPKAHYQTTGPEIWEQTEGKITHFICGMGTGGTMSGVGRFLKEKNPKIKVIGADPYGSIIKTFRESGKITEGTSYLVEGIGEDQIPETLHIDFLDEVYNVSDKDSFNYARRLAREEGIFCGGSTGTQLKVALDLAQTLDEKSVIVFMACDHGDRYFSKMYNDEWMRENQFLSLENITVKRVIDTKKESFKELIHIHPSKFIEDAFKLMNKKGISQIPVIEDDKQVGSLDENDVMKLMIADKDFTHKRVRDVMGDSFPSVQSNQNIKDLKELLKKYPSVMVENQGRMIGLLTRADIIEFTL